MIDIETLQAHLETLAADYVKRLGVRISAIRHGEIDLVMPVAPELVHAGGVVCGQAILAACDTAMVLAMIAELGEYLPMTTVQLQTTFLRPVPGDAPDVMLTARVLRRGKSLCYGEIELHTRDGKLAAHATTTYALL